jgi:hypothetical protein
MVERALSVGFVGEDEIVRGRSDLVKGHSPVGLTICPDELIDSLQLWLGRSITTSTIIAIDSAGVVDESPAFTHLR